MSGARRGILAALLLCVASAPAAAHPLAPALLELSETGPGEYAVLFRLSAVQPMGTRPTPVLPTRCERTAPRRVNAGVRNAYEARWTVDCGRDLVAGDWLRVTSLGSSGINAIVRVERRDGEAVQGLVDAAAPGFTLPARTASLPPMHRYLSLGFEHLLFGPDHILFLVVLMLLVREPRRLLTTLTAFTLGHSLTLAAAALGAVRVNPALMETGIALSVVVAARELLAARPSPLGRWPAVMAFAFGLLHGLGFAGALAGIGLPADRIVSALLAFNVGIELAQIAVACVCAWPLWRLYEQPAFASAGRPVVPAYAVGALGAFWCIQRLMIVATGAGALTG